MDIHHEPGRTSQDLLPTLFGIGGVDGRSAAICGVGDSRVYLTSRIGLTQLTTDHTWVETIRAQDPTIEPEVLEHHPMRHVLTAVIGGQSTIDAAVTEITLEPGDRLVMCSDGVYRGVSDELIGELATDGSVQDAAAAIVSTALERDGRDNIAAIVAEMRS